MDIRWCVLESNALRMDEVFDVLRRFVVHFVQSRFEAASSERIVCRHVGAKKLFLGPILDGHEGDEVGVINVKYDKVSVASVGRDWKTPCLISVQVAGGFMGCHVHQIGSDVAGCWCGDVDAVVGKDGSGVGAPLALPGLVHVAFGCRIVDGDVATNACCGEARKSF